MARRSSRSSARWALLLALFLATAWLYAALWSAIGHTLAARPVWVSTKQGLERDAIGATTYVRTPMALHGNRLNVGAWHGFQEVHYREPVSLRELRFRLLLPDDSVLSVIYGANENDFSGFRLSRNPHFPSLHFTADIEGRFLGTTPLGDLALGDGWQDLRVHVDDAGVALAIGSREVARATRATAVPGRVGFRGELRDAYVDDVEILTDGAGAPLRESFDRPPVSRPRLLGIFAALVLVFVGGAFLLARRGPPEERAHRAFFLALTLDLVLLFSGGALFAVERLLLSGRHGYSALHFKIQKRLERPPKPDSSWRVVLPSLRARYADSDPGDAERIFLIGTSQTWGSGARTAERDLARRLEAGLAQRFGPGRYEVVNAAVSGKTSAFLYEHYADEWIEWKPSLVVLNLGHNDLEPGVLREHLEKFVALSRGRGIDTVFVLEANHIESPNLGLARNHELMREIADRLGVDVIDLHGPLIDRYDDGFLWWDVVHLTDFGQQLAADVLVEGLSEKLAAPGAEAGR